MSLTHRGRPCARAQDGLTMIIAVGVMFVTSLLLVAAFTAASGDVQLSHTDTIQKQAYYAALAGVQEYEYMLQNNPNYWQKCEGPSGEEAGQHYEVTPLIASTAPIGTKACSSANPFETMIESDGAVNNTFRIESIGCAGKTGLTTCKGQSRPTVTTRKIVATFQVVGFLNYVYFTKYELIDPGLYSPKAPCEEYYEGGKRSAECRTLVFAEHDSVKGPMKTDDAAHVTCSNKVVFGRPEQTPFDAVEIDGGTWPSCGGSGPIYNTESGKPAETAEMSLPANDESLKAYVEHAPQQNELSGRNELVLEESTNTITDKYFKKEGGKAIEKTQTLEWPKNGLLYVTQNEEFECKYEYTNDNSFAADNAQETEEELGCATVYVRGTYSKSLTIGSESELVVNGNIIPSGVTGGNAPTGTTALGLIASQFVRVYHPCTNAGEQPGYLKNPWIYAAILSTSHSFIVDNNKCGEQSKLGYLGVYGAIAQKFRGQVGVVGTNGYLKDYRYDERLATGEPPYFLAPLQSGWKVIRETSPEAG
jgi:hypothetical protein